MEPSVMVAVCTFRRNEPLARLLASLQRNQDELEGRARLGVVVVDDNPDQRARAVCQSFDGVFSLGLHYRHIGGGNISDARNCGLETALPLSDWVAMTDDDCEPVARWIAGFLDTQQATGADALTGPCVLVAPDDAPPWLSEQPFLEQGQFRFDDGQVMSVAATNNSLFRSSFFRERPWLRFDPALGKLGGEDMVFFRTAHRAGLTIRFAAAAVVHGHLDPDRAAFGYQVRSSFWLGNTEFVTNHRLGDARRTRWLLRSGLLLGRSAVRPLVRLASGRAPHWRFAVASSAQAVGMLVGCVGLRIRHR